MFLQWVNVNVHSFLLSNRFILEALGVRLEYTLDGTPGGSLD